VKKITSAATSSQSSRAARLTTPWRAPG
jgi:hypothetical protein